MKFPCLVNKRFCQTPIEITLYQEGINEDGEPLKAITYSGKCNYQASAKTVTSENKRLVQITGQAFLPGDIAPSLAVISSGEVLINGVKRRIYQGTKSYNPDGTVNYTRLDLM